MVRRDPVTVRQGDVVAERAMARLVVHLAGRTLERVEDDVLVVPRDHALREVHAIRVLRIEMLARGFVLPPGALVEPFDAHDAERGCELVQAVVQPGLRVIRLAVVAEPVRKVDQLRVPRDEHSAFSGRDRLGGSERPDARVAPGAGTLAVPRGTVRMRAILE